MEDSKYQKKISQNNMKAYRSTQVITSNPEKILLLLYSGAIKFLKKAMAAKGKDQELDRLTNIRKCQEIILELRSTLDHKVGKEIAANLDNLYGFIITCLLRGISERDNKQLADALKVIETLEQTWQEAVKQLEKQRASQK